MIAILGSGLSGLLAARALWDNGYDFEILTKDKRKPDPKGFMLLHDNCNLVLEKCCFPVFQGGSEEEYKKKLSYGGSVNSSWKSGLKEYWMAGYNPYQAIEYLHALYEKKMKYCEINPDLKDNLCKDYYKVISTIPPNNLFPEIKLESTEIFVEELEGMGKKKAEIIYNGYKDNTITRHTLNLWGRSFIESTSREFSIAKTLIVKPIKAKGLNRINDSKIILAGRKGLWNKNVLAHQVYYQISGKIKRGEVKDG